MADNENDVYPGDPVVAVEGNSPEARVVVGEPIVSRNAGSVERPRVPGRAGRSRGAEDRFDERVARDAGVSDCDLVRRAVRGDRDAFGTLVLRYQDAVYCLAWRILRSREDAEDAAQESFLRAWRGLHRFDPKRSFRGWILRIAANFALTARSRRRTHLELDREVAAEDHSGTGLPSPAAAASRRELLDAVDRMADMLPPESAALFYLRYGEELPLKEISRILDRRPGALAVALHRIRERFRCALFGRENNEGDEP